MPSELVIAIFGANTINITSYNAIHDSVRQTWIKILTYTQIYIEMQLDTDVHVHTCQVLLFSCIYMGWCKKDVTPLLTHWSYVFLALTHWYDLDTYVRNELFDGYEMNMCMSVTYKQCLCNQIREKHRQTSNISHTLVGNKIADHSDVVGASPVGPTSSFSI